MAAHREGPSASVPTWQTRRLIRPPRPRSDKTLERLVFRLKASNFRLADVRRGGRLTGVWRFTERNSKCLFAFNSDSLQENIYFFNSLEVHVLGRTLIGIKSEKTNKLFFSFFLWNLPSRCGLPEGNSACLLSNHLRRIDSLGAS